MKVTLIDGQRDGLMEEFYENGQIKAKSFWKNDSLHGKSELYYPDGSLNEVTFWENGLRNGEIEIFYESGQLKFKGQYKNDKLVGKNTFFYEDGTKMEEQIYDNEGSLIDFYKYDENGHLRLDALKPIYTFSNDTIKLGEEVTLNIRIGNRISDNVQVMLGSLFNDVDKLGLKDTLVVLDSDNYIYNYRYIPQVLGRDSLTGKVIHILEKDSLEYIDEFRFTYRYFVTD